MVFVVLVKTEDCHELKRRSRGDALRWSHNTSSHHLNKDARSEQYRWFYILQWHLSHGSKEMVILQLINKHKYCDETDRQKQSGYSSCAHTAISSAAYLWGLVALDEKDYCFSCCTRLEQHHTLCQLEPQRKWKKNNRNKTIWLSWRA